MLSAGCVPFSRDNMQRTKQDRSRKGYRCLALYCPPTEGGQMTIYLSPFTSWSIFYIFEFHKLMKGKYQLQEFEDSLRVSSTDMD